MTDTLTEPTWLDDDDDFSAEELDYFQQALRAERSKAAW